MTLLFALGAVPMFGQIDIKEFDKVGRDAIVAMLGEPLPNRPHDEDIPDMIFIRYQGLSIGLYKLDNLDFVEATTPVVCFLSDYIPGGIKVGDSFEKLQSYDFANSVYGRGKPGNGVSLFEPGLYVVFKEEFHQFYFYVADGIITEILMSVAEDLPYENYDYSNRLW